MINSANREYEVTHDSQLAYVLSNLNEDYIYSSVQYALTNKIRNYGVPLPNIITACETNFNIMKRDYPNQTDDVNEVRERVYTQIIKLLCDAYQLKFDDTLVEDYDIKTSAELMYSFLVSNFQANIVNFFVNYIIKEKTDIYDMLELSGARKNKDTSTIYAKKLYKNPKIGVISANIELVINSIINTFGIDFNTYLNYVYLGGDKYIARHLANIITPVDDLGFIRTYIGTIFAGEAAPVLITSIRLALQACSIEADDLSIVKEE